MVLISQRLVLSSLSRKLHTTLRYNRQATFKPSSCMRVYSSRFASLLHAAPSHTRHKQAHSSHPIFPCNIKATTLSPRPDQTIKLSLSISCHELTSSLSGAPNLDIVMAGGGDPSQCLQVRPGSSSLVIHLIEERQSLWSRGYKGGYLADKRPRMRLVRLSLHA